MVRRAVEPSNDLTFKKELRKGSGGRINSPRSSGFVLKGPGVAIFCDKSYEVDEEEGGRSGSEFVRVCMKRCSHPVFQVRSLSLCRK